MANRDRDDMNRDGNAGKAIIVILSTLAAAGAGRKLKKKQQIADLKRQLVNVQLKKSQLQDGFVSKLQNAQEIKALEKQEAEIQRKISELGG